MRKCVSVCLVLMLIMVFLCGCAGISNVTDRPNLDISPAMTREPDQKTPSQTPTPTPKTSYQTATPAIETKKPEIEILERADGINIFCPARDYVRPLENTVSDWEAYILDKYDYDINLTYIDYRDSFAEAEMGVDTGSIETLSGLDGFVFLNSREDLNALIAKNMIMPVNEYIGQVPEIAVLDDKAVANLADREGRVWAFPLMESRYPGRDRVYNADWLIAAGMDVPATVDEFYEFALFVANEDPDGNGKDDSYVCDVSSSMFLYAMEDIFRAYGCYSAYNNPVGYNPNTGLYENVVFNENFTEAIMFIRTLIDEGAVKVALDSSYYSESGKSYKLASGYNLNPSEDYINSFAFGFYLMGTNDRNLIEERSGSRCIAVLGKTFDVTDPLCEFLSIAGASMESFMDFQYGIEGEHYIDCGDYYEIKESNRLNTYKYSRIGLGLYFGNSSLNDKPVRYEGWEENVVDENYETYREDWDASREAAYELLDSELAYVRPLEAYSNKLDNIEAKTFEANRELFRSLLDLNSDIETALADYRKKLDVIRFDDLLAEVNADLMP